MGQCGKLWDKVGCMMITEWDETYGIYSDIYKDIHGFRPRLNFDEYVPSIVEMEAWIRKMISTEAIIAEAEAEIEQEYQEDLAFKARMEAPEDAAYDSLCIIEEELIK